MCALKHHAISPVPCLNVLMAISDSYCLEELQQAESTCQPCWGCLETTLLLHSPVDASVLEDGVFQGGEEDAMNRV